MLVPYTQSRNSACRMQVLYILNKRRIIRTLRKRMHLPRGGQLMMRGNLHQKNEAGKGIYRRLQPGWQHFEVLFIHNWFKQRKFLPVHLLCQQQRS